MNICEQIEFSETIKTGSRVNDDAARDEDALGLRLVKLDRWAYVLKTLCRDGERASCCIMSFLLTFDAFDVRTDIVRWLS